MTQYIVHRLVRCSMIHTAFFKAKNYIGIVPVYGSYADVQLSKISTIRFDINIKWTVRNNYITPTIIKHRSKKILRAVRQKY